MGYGMHCFVTGPVLKACPPNQVLAKKAVPVECTADVCAVASCLSVALPPAVGNMRDGVYYIFGSFLEAAGFTVGRARAYTGAAANLAGQVRMRDAVMY
jgi:hypothetical protein